MRECRFSRRGYVVNVEPNEVAAYKTSLLQSQILVNAARLAAGARERSLALRTSHGHSAARDPWIGDASIRNALFIGEELRGFETAQKQIAQLIELYAPAARLKAECGTAQLFLHGATENPRPLDAEIDANFDLIERELKAEICALWQKLVQLRQDEVTLAAKLDRLKAEQTRRAPRRFAALRQAYMRDPERTYSERARLEAALHGLLDSVVGGVESLLELVRRGQRVFAGSPFV